MRQPAIILSCFLLLFLSGMTTPVYAYLDPGTGSVLVQGLLAGTAGVVAIIKIFWYRIKNIFTGFFAKWTKKNKSRGVEDDAPSC